MPSRDRHIRANSVHAQLSWFDDERRLSIVPDITIIEPEHVSILYGYEPPLPPYISPSRLEKQPPRQRAVIDPFAGSGSFP
jgi:hypothetical protein